MIIVQVILTIFLMLSCWMYVYWANRKVEGIKSLAIDIIRHRKNRIEYAARGTGPIIPNGCIHCDGDLMLIDQGRGMVSCMSCLCVWEWKCMLVISDRCGQPVWVDYETEKDIKELERL